MGASEGQPDAKRVKIAGAPVDSNECITFHILKRTPEGSVVMEEDGHFPPEMTHQLFEDEEIKGYDGLEIDIFMTPAFQALIDVKYASRESKGATDLAKPFKETFEAGFFEEKGAFDKAFEAEPALRAEDFGTCVASAETDEITNIQVFHTTLATAPETVRSLHARLQPLLLFFVDAACTIDSSDPKWELLTALETSSDGSCEVVGFATVYNFYVYPDRSRLRLSQVLVLPPHQGRGVGTLLVEGVYALAKTVDSVDITLEDPTDDLRRLRDRKDLKAMLHTQWVIDEASNVLKTLLNDKGKAPAVSGNGAAAGVNNSPLAPKLDVLTKMQKEFRMSRQQARRMWESFIFAIAVPMGGSAVAAAEGLVQATIEALVAAAKKGSEGKAVTETSSGFVMCKTKKKIAPGAVPVEGMTAEQQLQAVQEAVEMRIAEVRRLVLGKSEDEEAEEEDDDE